ncbi:MAG: hypothetical protein IJ291_02755 [Lachnospiraceae bacterium]|nr:hypothetical protein [Lachnospiraceae bacterium]
MSKNFEEAYKAEVLNDIPDLWDRIEAGLTPRAAAVVPDVSEAEQTVPVKKKKKSLYKFLYVAMPAAAVVLVFLISIPVVLSMVAGRSYSKDSAPSGQKKDEILNAVEFTDAYEMIKDNFVGADSAAQEEIAMESETLHQDVVTDENLTVEEALVSNEEITSEPVVKNPELVTAGSEDGEYRILQKNLKVEVLAADNGRISVVPVSMEADAFKSVLGAGYAGCGEGDFTFLYSLESACEPEAGKTYLCRIQEEDEGEALLRIVLIEEVTQ